MKIAAPVRQKSPFSSQLCQAARRTKASEKALARILCTFALLHLCSSCSGLTNTKESRKQKAPADQQQLTSETDGAGQDFTPQTIFETVRLKWELPSGWQNSDNLEPQLVSTTESVPGQASASLQPARFRVSAYSKRLPQFPDSVRVDLFIENLSSDVLRGITLNLINASHALIDATNDPFASSPSESFTLRGLGARGIGRIILRVPISNDLEATTVSLFARLTAETGLGESTSSSPLAISKDGSEIWIPYPDGNTVSIIDGKTDTEITKIQLEGSPTSVAFAAGDQFALIASAQTNTISIFNRKTRTLVQTLTEADGLGRELRHMVAAPDGQSIFVSGYVSDTVTWIGLRSRSLESRTKGATTPFEVMHSLKIGRRPTGISVTADGSQILVSHFLPRGPITDNEAWVSAIKILANQNRLELLDEVVYRDTFNLKEASCLAQRFGNRASPEQLSGEGVLSELAGVYLDPGANQAWIPAMKVPGIVPLIELGPNHQPISDTVMPDTKGEFFGALNVGIDTRDPLHNRYLRAQGVLDMDDVDQTYIQCSDLPEEMEFGTFIRDPQLEQEKRVLMKGVNLPSGVTQLEPTAPIRAAAYTQGGRALAMVSFGSDELALANATTHHPLSRRHFTLPGSNPHGIAMSPNGTKAYVVYENAPYASVLDMSAYTLSAQEPAHSDSGTNELGAYYVPYRFNAEPKYLRGGGVLTRKRIERDVSQLPESPRVQLIKNILLSDSDPMDPVLRRGKILFSSANPEKHPNLTASKLVSCGGCHPDGGSDGSAWSTVEGERRTMSLRGGVAGRGWLHAAATHKDSEEFASIIVRERMGGNLPPEDIEALARYVAFGIPRLQSPAVDPKLTARGEMIFAKSCGGCHSGPQLGSGNAAPGHPLGGATEDRRPILFNIGTAIDRMLVGRPQFFSSLRRDAPESAVIDMLWGDRELGQNDPVQAYLDFTPRPDRQRGFFKAPALTNVWDNVLFFHDGRFTTLDQVLSFFNDRLNLNLSETDYDALKSYLQSL
jgi:YVTN family beta-propeller protein